LASIGLGVCTSYQQDDPKDVEQNFCFKKIAMMISFREDLREARLNNKAVDAKAIPLLINSPAQYSKMMLKYD
jgi:hypothetical protein